MTSIGLVAQPVALVAVGASAGGVNALTSLVQALPADLDAALLVVLHIAPTGPSLLPAILTRAGPLPACHATDGVEVEAGRIYVAPPDRHLTLIGNTLRVDRSPSENGVRPSVDTLFRSVARSAGRRAVGIILSGTLDDGTAGLIAMAEAGGRSIVQDPEEAVFPGMPASAVRYANPEFVMPLNEIGPLVTKLVAELPDPSEVARVETNDVELTRQAGQGPPSAYTCPDCGGTLFEEDTEDLLQFRCRVGHGYSADSLLIQQQANLESALYSAIVALEERADLSRRVGRRLEQAGRGQVARRYIAQAEETESQARVVREAVSRLALPPDQQKP